MAFVLLPSRLEVQGSISPFKQVDYSIRTPFHKGWIVLFGIHVIE